MASDSCLGAGHGSRDQRSGTAPGPRAPGGEPGEGCMPRSNPCAEVWCLGRAARPGSHPGPDPAASVDVSLPPGTVPVAVSPGSVCPYPHPLRRQCPGRGGPSPRRGAADPRAMSKPLAASGRGGEGACQVLRCCDAPARSVWGRALGPGGARRGIKGPRGAGAVFSAR